MTKANTKYKTVKRKANVGERILITKAFDTEGEYDNGDVFTVGKLLSAGVLVKENEDTAMYHREYEVIVDTKPSKNERITALETQVAELQAELQTLKKSPFGPNFQPFIKKDRQPTPNEQRKAVIERAKAFIEESLNRNYPSFSTPKIKRTIDSVWFKGDALGGITDKAEFIVNADKRTVVALIKTLDGKLVHKGIAKCAPDDVFNADIGKAIALGRALGLDVSEFENAPKPTEVVVGMVVDTYIDGDFFKTVKPMKVIEGHRMYSNLVTAEYTPYDPGDKIIDDTEAQY